VVISIKNSNDLKERIKKVSPHYTQTFSRSPTSFVEGVYPVFAEKAQGAYFTDVDGNNFIDYLLALGPITLGHNYSVVNQSIIDQLNDGILFSLPHRKELELSELLCKTIPHTQMVKFEKSGSNAVTGALRAARAITKRDKVAYCGSGGVWHDWYAAAISRDGGVPKFNDDLIKIFDYNDLDGLEEIFEQNKNEIAAIVFEPTVYEKPLPEFLSKIRKIADSNNSILILDEIVTGFRFALGGCQEYFNLKGDFVCFGKGMGNGLAISAITGSNEFMKIFDKLWVSTTNASETLSLAGTIATINEMESKHTISHCWEVGQKLFEGWNQIAKEYEINSFMTGYPIRMTMNCKDSKNNESISLKGLILQEMVKRGIFIAQGPIFISYSHKIEEIQKTLSAWEDVCKFIKKQINTKNYFDILEGKLPQSVYTHKILPTKKSS
jgi:glutamate-1-semialdehyde 2,1-aminomutase